MGIEKFETFQHTHENISHQVFFTGNGPPVIVIHELPGMTPECIKFAERLVKDGFTVYLPLLFGEPNSDKPLGYFARVCISREFYLLARNKSSPIINWLRDLCRTIHDKKGGKGVGAIGMCLTGGFAIPLMVEPSMMAPVLSQPSLPLSVSRYHKRSIGSSKEELKIARRRAQDEGIPIRAYRFSKDPIAPKARMIACEQYFGDVFQYIELDSSQQAKYNKGRHSVFTKDYVDIPGHPTHEAYLDLVQFFENQLK